MQHPASRTTLSALERYGSNLQSHVWEYGLASQFSGNDAVLERLDYVSYFDLTRQPLPDNRDGILQRLIADRLVQQDVGGRWAITNLGAILFARRLEDFPAPVARKAIRFVSYDGASRADTVIHRKDVERGYAAGFGELVDYIGNLLPRSEQITVVFREEKLL